MVPIRNTQTSSRAIQVFDKDDIRYLVPFSQEGRLGSIVSLRRSSSTFVDELLSNRNSVLDADHRVLDDVRPNMGEEPNNGHEQNVEGRQRRHAFRRAAQRIFSALYTSIGRFFGSWRSSPSESGVTGIDTGYPQSYKLTLADRTEDCCNLIVQVRRDLVRLLLRGSKEGKNTPTKDDIQRANGIPQHFPKHRHGHSIFVY